MSPLSAASRSSSGVGLTTGSGGAGSVVATGSASATASLLLAASEASPGGSSSGAGGATGVGRSWVSQFRPSGAGTTGGVAATSSAASIPAADPTPTRIADLLTDENGDVAGAPPASSAPSGFDGFPPLAGAASAPGESLAQVGCAERDRGASRATAPSTPLPPDGETTTPRTELKEGDAVEAQFLLTDQAVWTTSWYRGKVSRVNRGGDENRERNRAGDGVTFGVEFADGDRLEEVPEGHIRLFRGLQVGSVVSVEWPSKGGRPFKGCLTRVWAGEGGNQPTVSVIYEDTDTEVREKDSVFFQKEIIKHWRQNHHLFL